MSETKLKSEIDGLIINYQEDSVKSLAGNKAAGARVRKATSALGKLFVAYRKSTIK